MANSLMSGAAALAVLRLGLTDNHGIGIYDLIMRVGADLHLAIWRDNVRFETICETSPLAGRFAGCVDLYWMATDPEFFNSHNRMVLNRPEQVARLANFVQPDEPVVLLLDENREVVAVVICIDRDQGASEKMAATGARVITVYRQSELIEVCVADGLISTKDRDRINAGLSLADYFTETMPT